MRKKSFSVFFWISVVLVAVLLFVVMGTTVEGFKSCQKMADCGGAKCTSSTGAKGNYYCKKPAGATAKTYGECTC
jgi:hypothetical protein